MKVFVVLAHHEPKSFNSAMFRTAIETLGSAGHQVRSSDLYAMTFDPVSDRRNFTTIKDPLYLKQQIEEMNATEVGGFAEDLETEMQKVEWADLMIWQFPLWWFGLPAILKGWADRVLAMGRFYGGGRVYRTGVLRGKHAMLSLTTGGPKKAYVRGGLNGDINGILRPIQRGILEFVGYDVLAPHVVYGPVRQPEETRKVLLESYADRLRRIEKEVPVLVGDY